MSDLDYSGKTILVVGGSSGIGNGIAQAYRARGGKVYIWGTRPSAEDYADEPGSNLEGLHYDCVDVGNHDLLENFQPPFEQLDVLILCQGIVRYGRTEFEKAVWDQVMDVNINSVMFTAMKFRGLLAESGGSIVVVSSIAGYIATKGTPAYGASKTAAVGLVRSLGEAFAGEGIRVNGIAPGGVQTKMTQYMAESPERLEQALRAVPLRRLGTPEDMAGVALFLTSSLASYMVGQTLIVDGGMTLS